MPATWYKIDGIDLNDKSDFIRSIHAGGRNLCLVHNDGNYYVFQSKCPHAGADLSQGWCEDGNLVCPYHRQTFDLNTGRGSEGQGNYIDTYPLEIFDGYIHVALPSWWQFWK